MCKDAKRTEGRYRGKTRELIYVHFHLLRCERPDFRRAAGIPCLLIPRDGGLAESPFDFLHSSFRDPRGP